MGTRITGIDHPWAISGAPERRLVESPSGRLWVAVHAASSGVKFFYSDNQGATWTYSGASDVDYSQGSTILSFFIDGEGYGHLVWLHWDASPQHIHYSRGVPSSDGKRFTWKTERLTPAAGRLGHDCDVVAFRRGTGWVVWIYFEYHGGGSRLARVGVSANGTLTVEANGIDPGAPTGDLPFGGLEFAHTGDGVTPQSSPHLFVLTGDRTTGSNGSVPDLELHRGRYQSGAWTFGTTVLLENAHIYETTAVHVWDGTLVCAAWSPTNSEVVRFATWDGLATTVTRKDPPAPPAALGVINGLSMSHDPVTDDIFVFIHDHIDGDIYYSRLVRATNTWSAWALAVSRPVREFDNKVQALRHPRYGNIDIVYATFINSSSGHLFHQRVLALSRKPGVPALVSPSNGALVDLNRGATFEHRYTPAGPGDSQQAWAFRRQFASTIQWWSVGSQAWQGTEIFNTGDATKTSFPAGAWPASTTYSWSVKTRSTTGVDSDYAPERTVVSTEAPVVDVLTPEGLIYSESTPMVTWSYTSTEPQQSYEIRVVAASSTIDPLDPGPAVWTSGVTTSAVAREHRVDTPLDPAVAYLAYVRATSSASLSSTWAANDFSLSLTPPSGPLVGVVDELAWPSDVPHARLNIQARTNYLLADQDLGQLGWEALTGATVAAQEFDLALSLEASLKVTTTAGGIAQVRTVVGDPPAVPPDVPAPLGPLDFPVRPLDTYTALGHFRPETAARAGRVSIEWYDSDEGDGVLISTSVGNQVNLNVGSNGLVHVTAAAPAGAVLARPVMEYIGASAAGEVVYVTRMSFHPGDVLEWQPGGFAETQTIHVERSDDDGATWKTVIDRVRTDFWQRATAIDRTVRLGVPVLYRAFTDVDLDNGSILTSLTSPWALATIDADGWVMRDPDDAASDTLVFVTDITRSEHEAVAVHRPAGRAYPVIDSEGEQSGEGTLELFVRYQDIPRTVELLKRAKTLIVQSPLGELHRMRFVSRDYSVELTRHRKLRLTYYEMEV